MTSRLFHSLMIDKMKKFLEQSCFIPSVIKQRGVCENLTCFVFFLPPF